MLDQRKIHCIDLLMEKKYTQEQIATMCGVSRSAVWDWRQKDKEFIAELHKREQELLEFKQTVSQKRFNDGLDTALTTLEDIMKNSKNDAARTNAANTWIDRALGKLKSKVEITEPIDDDTDEQLAEDFETWADIDNE